MNSSALDDRRRDPVFLSQPSPTVLLCKDLTIRAATASYLRVTGRREDELVSEFVFDAFPENAATAAAGSSAELTRSWERVMQTRRPHHLGALRYDLPDTERPGEFVERRWALVSTVVEDDHGVAGVMVRAEDLTTLDRRLVSAFQSHHEAWAESCPQRSGDPTEAMSAFLALVESHARLGEEVESLRQALRSRPVIEQAKGIVMRDRRCTADEAFQLIRKLSMDTNVRVADVAAAIVYQVAS